MIWSRRRWLLVASGALTGCSPPAKATGCGSLSGTTIKWIVPFGDGGSHEVYSRTLEPFYERSLGAEVVIAIEPGGGGLVGATKLRDAPPDGRTVGILNGPGLLMAAMWGPAQSPSPARDFAILGRLGRSRPVLAVAAASSIKNLDDLIALQRTRPIVCGISGMASNSLLVFSMCESLLGLRMDYVAGFSGSRDITLAVLRGDTDLLGTNFDSMRPSVAQGDVRVLVQLADRPISDDPLLSHVPLLGGPGGWAERRALELGRDPGQAVADATAFSELTGAGILVAAPKNLPGDLLSCLRSRLYEAASSADFQAAARAAQRTPEVAPGEQAQAEIAAAERHVRRFAPIVRAAFERARK